MTANLHESRARAVKVARLVRVLDRVASEMHWTPDDLLAAVEQANEVTRAKVARMAGTRVPSAATWQAVIGTVGERLRVTPSRDDRPNIDATKERV